MCNSPIYEKLKQFCNHSCSASYNNLARPQSISSNMKRRQALLGNTRHREKYGAPKHMIILDKICIICNDQFSQTANRKSTTCSKECSNAHHSLIMKEKIKNGYNPNKHRGRHKRSYMETSFESWLNHTFPSIIYDTEHAFRSLAMNKTFFTDFYFEDLNLAIELDGTQHKSTVEYDIARDANILLEHGVYVYRISHKEYQSGIKIDEVKNILSMSDKQPISEVHVIHSGNINLVLSNNI